MRMKGMELMHRNSLVIFLITREFLGISSIEFLLSKDDRAKGSKQPRNFFSKAKVVHNNGQKLDISTKHVHFCVPPNVYIICAIYLGLTLFLIYNSLINSTIFSFIHSFIHSIIH